MESVFRREQPLVRFPRSDPFSEYLTLLLVFLTVAGLYLDVWSHGQGVVKSFFKVWHAPFYAGYLATAVWLLRPVGRVIRKSPPPASSLPGGFAYDVVGLGLFAVGVLTGTTRHTLLGLETGVDVSFSPSRLFLFLGLILIASSPFRAAARERPRPAAVSLRDFMPALLSLTLATSIVALALIHLWGMARSPYMTPAAMAEIQRFGARDPNLTRLLRDIAHARGFGNIVISTLVLLGPIILMFRRWQLPFGALTTFLTGTVWLIASVTGFWIPLLLAVPVLAGLVADSLVHVLRPTLDRTTVLRVCAVTTPVVLWSLYLLAVALQWGLAWTPSAWTGVILWTGLIGCGVSLVAVPNGSARPAMTTTAQNPAITLTLVTMTIVGLFVDIWSHGQPGSVETFLNPVHAAFILPFLGTAGYLLWPVTRLRPGGRREALRHYGMDVAGVLCFAAGLTGDLIWHSIFGLETSVEALTSPPHVFVVLGIILMVSGPFRAAWADSNSTTRPTLRAFLPTLLSLSLATSLGGLLLTYLWGFTSSHYMTPQSFRLITLLAGSASHEAVIRDIAYARAIANILITNAVLLAPVLIVLQRWRPPLGSVAILFTLPTMLMAAVTGFFLPRLLLLPVIAGLAADGLIRVLQPSPRRIASLRLFAAIVPVILWGLYFVIVRLEWGLVWSPALWGGVIIWTGLEGLAVSLLVPPHHPDQ